MKRSKKIVLMSGALVALVGLAVGGILWSRRSVVTVQTGKVVREDLTAIVTASGEIKPPSDKFAAVNANSFGKIVEILVKEGDQVKKGQLLLKTESVQQDADVQAQEAALKTAMADASASEAAVQSSAANLKTLQADLEQAKARLQQARDDFNRGQQLLKDQLIAQQVFDQRRSDFSVAQATVQSAEARVAQARALYEQALYNRDMQRARIAQNRAQLVHYSDLRDKTIYTSPLDGVITSLPVHQGENVVPGIQNQPGSVLFQVSDLSVITAEVMVDEADIINVKMGQPADVAIDAVPNKTFKGHVTEIGMSAVSRNTGQIGTATTTSEEAKDFRVVVTLDNPPPNLRPGLSTTAKIITATRKNAVAVPIQALTVRQRGELAEPQKKTGEGRALAADASALDPKEKERRKEEIQGVFVVRKGRAVFVPVDTGIMGTTDAEVLKGVEPGEEIITGAFKVLRTLKNKAKVKIDNTPQTSGASPARA